MILGGIKIQKYKRLNLLNYLNIFLNTDVINVHA